jgi:sugar/nucleoside kinase (ribokinase family)
MNDEYSEHEEKFDVLVAGELNIDIILDQLEKFPVIGKEILANKLTVTLGSSSAIFASNLSALGVSVIFCGCIGNDNFGDKILNDLAEKNVATQNIISSNTTNTGITVALNFNQDRAMVTYPGAMNELTSWHITDAILQSAKHLHVSSVFLQPALKPGLIDLFERAKRFGLTTSLDPQWDPSEQWHCDWKNLLPCVDVFLPNTEEIKNITHQPSIKDAMNVLRSYSNIVVVKNGSEGASVFFKDEVIEEPAFVNNEFADAIGAGDSFDAGFIRNFIQQKTLKECATLGVVCGAINTTAHGGTTAFKNLNDIKKIASEKFNYSIE